MKVVYVFVMKRKVDVLEILMNDYMNVFIENELLEDNFIELKKI